MPLQQETQILPGQISRTIDTNLFTEQQEEQSLILSRKSDINKTQNKQNENLSYSYTNTKGGTLSKGKKHIVAPANAIDSRKPPTTRRTKEDENGCITVSGFTPWGAQANPMNI